jgi:hypothetical protein
VELLLPCPLQTDSDAAAAVWGCTEIYHCTGPGIDPYFHLSVSNPSDGWQKEWFFLRNYAKAPLPMVMGKSPAVQPRWWYRVAKKDTRKWQPCMTSSRLCSEMGWWAWTLSVLSSAAASSRSCGGKQQCGGIQCPADPTATSRPS